MKSNMSPSQWKRLQALARVITDEGAILQAYRGDVVYDGAIMAETAGPMVFVLRDSGTQLTNQIDDVEAYRKVFGESDERARYYFGEGSGEDYAFRRVTSEEAISLLREAQRD